jgi:hypothetical protein
MTIVAKNMTTEHTNKCFHEETKGPDYVFVGLTQREETSHWCKILRIEILVGAENQFVNNSLRLGSCTLPSKQLCKITFILHSNYLTILTSFIIFDNDCM